MLTYYKTREVEYEIEFNRHVEDTFIAAAWYVDDGESLTDEDISELQEQEQQTLGEEWFMWQVSEAEYRGEEDR